MSSESKSSHQRVPRPLRSRALQVQGGHLKPPPLKSHGVYNHTYRFIASAAATGNLTITSSNVFGALGTICNATNSTVSYMFTGFRLNSIEVWTYPDSSGALATPALTWQGTSPSPNAEVMDTTGLYGEPAHFKTRPPKNSEASFWQSTSTANELFKFSGPVGTVLDLNVTMVLRDNLDTSASATVSTATNGLVYYLALDGVASNKLVPIGLRTTT